MLKLETSQFLDKAMIDAMMESSAWSEDGQIIYVRERMQLAYEKAREIEGHDLSKGKY